MKIKYFWLRPILVTVRSGRKYEFRPGSEINIDNNNFIDIYDLIRHPMHWHYFKLEWDPEYNSFSRQKITIGIWKLGEMWANQPKVMIKTKSQNEEKVIVKTTDEVVEDIENIVENTKEIMEQKIKSIDTDDILPD